MKDEGSRPGIGVRIEFSCFKVEFYLYGLHKLFIQRFSILIHRNIGSNLRVGCNQSFILIFTFLDSTSNLLTLNNVQTN